MNRPAQDVKYCKQVMTIKELNKEQLTQVKQNYYTEILMEQEDREPSWGELVEVDDLVTDEEVFTAYDGTEFVEEDFCTC